MGQSTPNPRHLTIDHGQNMINPVPMLKQGEQQLYSYCVPCLQPGEYNIDVTQTIVADTEKTTVENTRILNSKKKFTVVAPRYTLPPGSIHSMDPAPGSGDVAKTLPHVVLNDPHLPWERQAREVGSNPGDDPVPWLAVLLFTRKELELKESFLEKTFPNDIDISQNTTMAIKMTIDKVPRTNKIVTPIPMPDHGKCATTDVIFLDSKLFTSLVTTYVKGKPLEGQKLADVSRYKYLAHVRVVSTKGMVIDNITGEASFSVVISHRVGPLGIKEDTPMVVHLVSIEGVEKMEMSSLRDAEFVALSSLHSWTYTCLDPRFHDPFVMFQHLGNTLDLLRAPREINLRMKNRRIRQRLTDGYSLVRYITQTGEETVAFTRGPLTPTTVKHPLRPNWGVSTFGTDLQIFDTELGIMDITYSSAWELGKALALADQPFAAALSRIRTQILDVAVNHSKMEAIRKNNPDGYKTSAESLKSLTETMFQLSKLVKSTKPTTRSQSSPGQTAGLPLGSEKFIRTIDKNCKLAVESLSTGTNKKIYNEFNTPSSTDWMLVFSWILDRMYLDNIPAHYLITDPTHLPRESLRFFHIDANWVDALVDGALSIANHVQCYDGRIRTVIKEMVNIYLETEPPGLKYLPQIPTYGFLLRSNLCSLFPDLVVEPAAKVPKTSGNNIPAPILYHKNLDDGVMLCLLDRVPSTEFESLTFTQPPHQQTFSAGSQINELELEVAYKRPYTDKVYEDSTKDDIMKCYNKPENVSSAIFLWKNEHSDIRTLLFPALADKVFKFNRDKIGHEKFTDTSPGSALMGFQLGTDIFKLRIDLEDKLKDLQPTAPLGVRFLLFLDPVPKKPVDHSVDKRREPVASSFHNRGHPPLKARSTLESPPIPRPVTPPSPKKLSRWIHYPIFKYQLYSVHSPKKHLLSTTYERDPPKSSEQDRFTTYEQDLVFSIVLESGGGNHMDLEKLVLSVPLGAAGACCPTLMKDYTGRVKMLGNLRFNVLAQLSDDTLTLTVLPRSVNQKVAIGHVDEMSFLMSLVKVNTHSDPKAVVTILVEEKYKDPKITLKSKFTVRLRQEKRDEDITL
ncbi:hypothetical protein Q9L58_009740 [Maublancomyces gigas]|uniref:Uncharacterized protein n=1 Tax=Discina gigas TaxID=1032678 RepID=A0ABR3G622_9PEZI